ncbi:unnamed protein product [Moneuplotes crassus]|uniref:Uncharacterized protein n=1 Tax=Euplotes crassus TaxID=5936 RepID=A0AAD1XT50_EUPCR|nr:unnamed protein product [Moneuplotes crassus]
MEFREEIKQAQEENRRVLEEERRICIKNMQDLEEKMCNIGRSDFKKITGFTKTCLKGFPGIIYQEFYTLSISGHKNGDMGYTPFSLYKAKIFKNLWIFTKTLKIEGFRLRENDIRTILVASRHLRDVKITQCQIPKQKFTDNFFNSEIQEATSLEEIGFNNCFELVNPVDNEPLCLVTNIMEAILNSFLLNSLYEVIFSFSILPKKSNLHKAYNRYRCDPRVEAKLIKTRISFYFPD